MKKIFLLMCFFTIFCYGQDSDRAILKKTITELNKIEDVAYTSTFTGWEGDVAYTTSEDTIFFDFAEGMATNTPKFIISGKDAKTSYDGQKLLQTLYREKVIIEREAAHALNPLMLTLYPIKVLLPKMVDRPNVLLARKKDTVIAGKNNYVIDVTVKDGRLDWNRLDIQQVLTLDTKYSLWINKSTYLPYKMIMQNGPSGSLSRTIDNLNFDHKVDQEEWNGGASAVDFKKISLDEYVAMLESNSFSRSKMKGDTSDPSKDNIGKWKLPSIDKELDVDFSRLKGNVVLLEFWFKNCGPCVGAVPRLNILNDTFKDKSFKFYGVEFREDFSRENLGEYAQKINVTYPLLYKGRNLASVYEVNSAPTFVLFDKNGNVVYHKAGFMEEELIKAINEHL